MPKIPELYPEFNGSRMGDAGHNILQKHGFFEFKRVLTANNVIIIPSKVYEGKVRYVLCVIRVMIIL